MLSGTKVITKIRALSSGFVLNNCKYIKVLFNTLERRDTLFTLHALSFDAGLHKVVKFVFKNLINKGNFEYFFFIFSKGVSGIL